MAIISNLGSIVCTGTATMVTYSGRNFIKDASGFALCGLYYTGSYKGPIVVSPTQSVARYSTSGNYSATATATSYVTINGVKWWYTPGSYFYSGNWNPSSGSYTYYIGQYSAVNAATALVNSFYESTSVINWGMDSSNNGIITDSGGIYSGYQSYWSNQYNINVTVYPIINKTLDGWYINNLKVSSANPYTIDTSSDVTVIAKTTTAGSGIIL